MSIPMSIPRCDMCEYKDGHNSLRLVTCSSCNLHVHQECYGLTDMTAQKFASGCPPCRAVGKEFEGKTMNGEIKKVVQNERPVDCVMCSVSSGIHALHPVYDVAGTTGRPMVLTSGKLAWVHTLCASSICQNRVTRGSVYGCDVTGSANEDATESNDDGSSGTTGSRAIDVTTHHYVICNPTDTEWWRVIRESRKLTCIGCGKKDDGLRIPIQCTAGDDEEYPLFKQKHRDMTTACMQAMHVGCAMWGRNKGTYRRIYFYPGSGTSDPVCECYCPQHARDIETKDVSSKGLLVRQSSHAMVGSDAPYDADRLKKLLESPTQHGKAVVPTLLAGTSNIDRPHQIKRSSKVLTHISLSRANSAPERPTQTSAHRNHSYAPSPRTNSTATMKRSSATTMNPRLERLDLGRHASVGALEGASIPKRKSPSSTTNIKHLFTSDYELPDLPTFDIRMKKSSTTSRPLDSYVTATKTLAPPPARRNVVTMKRGSITSTKDLPPPPYQRQSSLIQGTKVSKGTTKRKNLVVDAGNDEGSASLDNDMYDESSRPVKKAPRRRYISESKMADDCYVDNFDWLEAMTSDVQKALAMAKAHESDPTEIMDARRSYWKRKSGIYGSDFVELWNKVKDTFSRDLVKPERKGSIESDHNPVEIEFNIEKDIDRTEFLGEDKWAHIWNHDSKLFQL